MSFNFGGASFFSYFGVKIENQSVDVLFFFFSVDNWLEISLEF